MADASFQREFLQTHNAYRAQHGAPALSLSSELNASAQRWADYLLSLGLMKHSDTKDGENIYTYFHSGGVNLSGKEAVDSWYDEVKDYSWSSPGFKGDTGHFTQVVWKDTRELGVGVAIQGTRAFVVGQYRPAGNMTNAGYFERNVLQKGSSGGGGGGSSGSGGGGSSNSKDCTLL